MVALALVAPVAATIAVVTDSAPVVAARTKEQRGIDVANAARAQAGLPSLVIRTQLTNAAKVHANDQARRNVMTHTGSDGSNAGTRIARQGYRWQRWAENVAMGYPSPEAVMRAWLSSPGHRANILNPSIHQVGMAYTISSSGRVYWTMALATRLP